MFLHHYHPTDREKETRKVTLRPLLDEPLDGLSMATSAMMGERHWRLRMSIAISSCRAAEVTCQTDGSAQFGGNIWRVELLSRDMLSSASTEKGAESGVVTAQNVGIKC